MNVVRFNTERAPEWQVALEPGRTWRVVSRQHSLASHECAGVWWRRPETPRGFAGATGAETEAINDQWRALLRGLAAVPGPRWVSPPDAIARAENKAAQLDVASRCGFPTPPTIWTNSKEDVERLFEREGSGIVVKSVASAYWERGSRSYFVFTRLVSRNDLPASAALRAAPLSFQRAIWPKVDIRATVVGRKLFAARASNSTSTEVDWRLGDVEWRPHELPQAVESRCLSLVEAFGLGFSAIDLVLDESGQYWFIELNPNGEWGWLASIGLPIAEALVEELLK